MENYDIKKLANFITYFIESDMKYLGITKLMKLCFFADKYHLEAYGTPILNHNYTKMPKGPVPMYVYSLIKNSKNTDSDDLESEVREFNTHINVKERQSDDCSRFESYNSFDRKFFSKSQMIILDKLALEFKDIDKEAISNLSHDTSAWKSVNLHGNISFSSMIDNNPELSKHVRENEIKKIQFNSNVQRVLQQVKTK